MGVPHSTAFVFMNQKRLLPHLYVGILLLSIFCALVLHLTTSLPIVSARNLWLPRLTSSRQTAHSPAVTTIRWFTRWEDERLQTIAAPLLAQFHAENPTIRVQLENVSESDEYYRQLRSQLERGQPPDLFYPATHIAYDLDQQGQLFPLDELLRADGLNLSASAEEKFSLYKDATMRLYCLPVDVALLAVVYNRSLFDAAKVAPPKAPWTWDDLLALATRLTQDNDGDGTIDQYGIDRFYTDWPLVVWSATGHNVFDDPQQPTAFLLEEEASVKAVQWLADLQLKQGVMPPFDSGSGQENLFLTGHAAMQITGWWQLQRYLAANLDIDVVPLPIGDYAVNRNDGSCLAIADKSIYPQAAWTFLKFLAGPSGIAPRMLRELPDPRPGLTMLYQQSLLVNPLELPSAAVTDVVTASTASTVTTLATWSGVSTIQPFPLYDPIHPLYAEWQPIVDRELRAVWLGRRSADEAIGRMANAAEDLIEDYSTPVQPALTLRQATKEISATANLATGQDEAPISDMMSQMASGNPSPNTIPLSSTTANSNSTALTAETPSALRSPLELPLHYFVAPKGNDAHSGLRATAPLATIQHALALVRAGDTIHLAPGDYFENLTSVNSGRAGAPITIMGPADAILHGAGQASAAFYLTDNYYTLTGFTIDGLFGDPNTKEGYTQKLLYVQGKGNKEGVTGLRVLGMRFQNAGGECVRLRYFAHQNEIAYSSFHICGLLDFVFGEGGKNGEGIYVGTAPDQLEDGKNPTADPDESSNNWIHHNQMDTQGNECVEIKEGGHNNLIEYNLCTGQLDPASAGIGARGSNNIIRYNTIYDNVGAGIRLGGHLLDGRQYGIDNEVYGNYLFGNVAGGVKIIVEPQSRICSNRLERNQGKQVFGEGSEAYDPTATCT